MSAITLKQALGVLAKSSSFSVKTASDRQSDIFDELKDYLYIKSDIEEDFERKLRLLQPGECIFLCGSSGDGKSEILSRSYEQYKNRMSFHLDATHSFAPDQSAIEALDELFDGLGHNQPPMVVGINIGMLANFAKEGAEKHSELKAVIEDFLETGKTSNEHYIFLDFESYPKFRFDDDSESYSYFIRKLLKKLTSPCDENLFHFIASNPGLKSEDMLIATNFKLLADESVQDLIITTLFKTRLLKDQFITTRALLDLIYQLIVGKYYLFDNLFMGKDSELNIRIAEFDPALVHTQILDQFVLRYELCLPDPELDDFLSSLNEIGIIFNKPRTTSGQAASLIRLFYLLKNTDFGNNYHHKFKHEFEESLLEYYESVWLKHSNYNGDKKLQSELRSFYSNELIPAIFKYTNRNAPELSRREFFLGEFGTCKVAAPVELKVDYNKIHFETIDKYDFFNAYLKLGEKELKPISINLNLFELICKLNNGYRPNKYDKNAIVLLDEIIEQVRLVAKVSPVLKYYEGGKSYCLGLDESLITVEVTN